MEHIDLKKQFRVINRLPAINARLLNVAQISTVKGIVNNKKVINIRPKPFYKPISQII